MIVWGSVPDSVGVFFTGLGFAAAVYQLREGRLAQAAERVDARDAESERREAMARAVGVKASWGETDQAKGETPVSIDIINSSPFPIDAVVVRITTDNEYPHEVVYGSLLPGEKTHDTFVVNRTGLVFGELTGGAEILFTDTYGGHWRRTPSQLERRDQMARIC